MNNTIYDQINKNISNVIQGIPSAHVSDYDYLIENLNNSANAGYQSRYKTYWRLHGAGLSQDYCDIYFQYLQNAVLNPLPLKTLVTELYQVPCSPNRKAIQFSFCTKLCHMIDRKLPIYDSKIAEFYNFKRPDSQISAERRINMYIRFYEFLKAEYQKVLDSKILDESIKSFRVSFQPKNFTDIKIIDSLIWGSAPKKVKEPSPREQNIQRLLKMLASEEEH